MKKMNLLLTCILLCTTIILKAQNQTAPPPPSADQKAMMANMAPGPIQAMMAKGVGDWKADVTMWEDPSQPPTKSTCTVKNEMIMGGRYMTSKFTGTMMGMPFEGMSTTAYDNSSKKFYSSWIDNMSTGMMQMTGWWNDSTKSIDMKGTSVDPMSGKDVMMRQTLTMNGDNDQLMKMYAVMGGKEMEVMEIHLTR
jgi:hypothetical protein